MKTYCRLNRQPRHLLSKLGLINVKKGNFAQHLAAQRRKERLNAKDGRYEQ
jgi:hypothetical protein